MYISTTTSRNCSTLQNLTAVIESGTHIILLIIECFVMHGQAKCGKRTLDDKLDTIYPLSY